MQKGKEAGKGKARLTQPHRPNNRPAVVKPRKDADIETGSDNAAPAGIRFSVLESELRPMSVFQLAMRSGNISDVLEIVDTEQKQLQAIEDLYRIVKAHPKYAKLKEPHWHESTPPADILYWLLKKLGPIADGRNWTIDTYLQKGKTRFQFVYYSNYQGTLVTYGCLGSYGGHHFMNMYAGEYIVPLDFLPHLIKRDKELHDIIVDLVALVTKENKIPLWDSDGDFSAGVASLCDPDNTIAENNEIAYQQREVYSIGPAYQYLKKIKQRSRNVKHEELSAAMMTYDAKSHRKYDVIDWASHGLAMASMGGNIQDAWFASYEHPETLVPFRKYKFVWSIHKSDYVHNFAIKKMRRDQARHGEILPVFSHILRPGQRKEIIADYFPERLSYFMNTGFKLFFARYEEYFYVNRLREEPTASCTLLDAIILSELKTAGSE